MALVYSVTAGPPTDSDVTFRTLTVVVNGETQSSTEYPPGTTTFGELVFEQGAAVVMTLVDTDDAGNPSSPASLEFVANDTIPPAAPGGFGVTLVRET